ncbi:MAG: hypothetical protein H6737_20035 [Alphaproteobacteria bacterium]|nr:hypothetical protein [Alphaproteobacteria bacterium]
MILVTGTPRSGTSMWMQILRAAGLPTLGDAFPDVYRDIHEANPAGFFESRLRHGVYFETNPDPRSGVYLHPMATREHVLKVFIAGLRRTDHAFIDRVVATLRPWRQFCTSFERLIDIENASMSERVRAGDLPDDALANRLAHHARSREALHPAIAWWKQIYALIHDASIRRYPVHVVAYERVLEDPRREVGAVLSWLGTGDLDRAVEAVRPELRTQDDSAEPVGLPDVMDGDVIAVFDAVYEALAAGALDSALITRMNRTNERLAT